MFNKTSTALKGHFVSTKSEPVHEDVIHAPMAALPFSMPKDITSITANIYPHIQTTRLIELSRLYSLHVDDYSNVESGIVDVHISWYPVDVTQRRLLTVFGNDIQIYKEKRNRGDIGSSAVYATDIPNISYDIASKFGGETAIEFIYSTIKNTDETAPTDVVDIQSIFENNVISENLTEYIENEEYNITTNSINYVQQNSKWMFDIFTTFDELMTDVGMWTQSNPNEYENFDMEDIGQQSQFNDDIISLFENDPSDGSWMDTGNSNSGGNESAYKSDGDPNGSLQHNIPITVVDGMPKMIFESSHAN